MKKTVSVLLLVALMVSCFSLAFVVSAEEPEKAIGVLYSEDFDTVTDFSTLGYQFSAQSDANATATVEGGQLVIDNTTGTGEADLVIKSDLDTTLSEWTLEAEMTLLSADGDTKYGALLGYWSDETHYAGAWIRENGSINFQKRDDGYADLSNTVLDLSEAGATAGLDQTYALKIHFHNGKADLYINNVKMANGNLRIGDMTSNVALMVKNGAKVAYDNIKITAIAYSDGSSSAEEDPTPISAITPDTSWYAQAKKRKAFTIRTAEQLAGVSELSNVQEESFYGWTLKLGNDIVFNTGNAEDWAMEAPVNIWTPISDFWGVFDGQGYVISGLYVNDVRLSDVGLFGYLNGGTVKNVSVVNSFFCGKLNIGSIAGAIKEAAGTVSGCYSDAIIQSYPDKEDGAQAGGIVGYNLIVNSVIEKCWFAGSVEAYSPTDNKATRVGGILGHSYGTSGASAITIENCLMTGSVTGCNQVGGIAGGLRSTNSVKPCVIKNCLMFGTVTTTRNQTTLFCGQFVGIVWNLSYATFEQVWGSDQYELQATKVTPSDTVKTACYSSNNMAGATVNGTEGVDYGKLEDASMIGDAAKTTLASFNFDTVWLEKDGSTPVLKDLETIHLNKASGKDPMPEDPIEPDEPVVDPVDTTEPTTETKKPEPATTEPVTEAEKDQPEETTQAKQKKKGGCSSSTMITGWILLLPIIGIVIMKKPRKKEQ